MVSCLLRNNGLSCDLWVVVGERADRYEIMTTTPRDGATTLVMAAVTEASVSPQDIVAAVETVMSQQCEKFSCEMWASAPAPLPLRPADGYSAIELKEDGEEGSCWENRATAAMREWGISLQKQVVDDEKVRDFRVIVDEAIAEAEEKLALHRPDIDVGKDEILFKEIASRNHERFDLRLTSSTARSFIEEVVLGNSLVQGFLRNNLGEMEEIDFDLSVVYSRPGANAQGWHADGAHQRNANDAGWADDGWKTRLADAYAICLFVPLIDLNDDVGFTQFWPGSHRSRDLIGFARVAEVTQATFDAKCCAGDGVWYDYRLWHQGMPNRSNVLRPVVQIIFKKKWYVERANYGTESIAQDTNS